MEIAGKVFLISGGASGLGAATVRMFHEAGGHVVVSDINDDGGAALAAELGERVRFIHADSMAEGDAQAAVDLAVNAFGGLNGLVNCAGIVIGEKVIGRNGPHALASFSRVIGINLIGAFNMIRLAAAAIAQQKPNGQGERGVIVNTASVAAFDGQIGQAAYAASKGGVAAMTLPLARDLAPLGIRVMTVAPGTFETPMMAGFSQEVRDGLAKQVPFPPRLGKPSEFAMLVRHIYENTMLNGEVIRLDGAIRMPPR